MAVSWKLSNNGGAYQTLEAWKIDRLTRTRRNLAVSEVVMSAAISGGGAGIYTAIPFSFGTNIVITRNDVIWFFGTVTEAKAYGAKGGERFHYTVSDAWWNLERIIYQQKFTFKSGTPPATLSMGLTGKVVLGKDEWGNVITQAAQITKIATFAGVFSSISIPSTLPVGYFIEAKDISCAEAIRRMLGITPDCVGYIQYVTGAAVLVIQRRGFLTGSSFNLANTDSVEVIDLGPRNDLLITGVQFIYLTTGFDISGNVWMVRTADGIGAVSGQGVIVATIELSSQSTSRPEAIPTGLAAHYYSTRNTLQWEGTVTVHEAECTDPAPLGHVLNLAGGNGSWANMNAMIQSVKEDIFTGVTEIDVGPAGHLGESDFLSLMSFFQKKKEASDFPEKQDNGTAGVPVLDGGDGADPDHAPVANPDSGKPAQSGGAGGTYQSVPITHCVDGVEQTDNVLKAP